jgi:hypothetical protein
MEAIPTAIQDRLISISVNWTGINLHRSLPMQNYKTALHGFVIKTGIVFCRISPQVGHMATKLLKVNSI